MAELDTPVTDTDKHVRQGCDKLISALIQTGQWAAQDFGPFNSAVIQRLSRALFDRACLNNPQIAAAVQNAIQQQQSIVMQLQMAAAMAQAPLGSSRSSPEGAAPPSEQAPEPQTVADLLDMAANG